ENSPMVSRSATARRALDAFTAEDPQSLDAVAPGDLLAFFPGTRAIADRYLVGTDAPAQQLAGDLGLHTEPAGAHVKGAVQGDRHQLEARLQVAEVAVVHHVRRRGDGLV